MGDIDKSEMNTRGDGRIKQDKSGTVTLTVKKPCDPNVFWDTTGCGGRTTVSAAREGFYPAGTQITFRVLATAGLVGGVTGYGNYGGCSAAADGASLPGALRFPPDEPGDYVLTLSEDATSRIGFGCFVFSLIEP